MDSLVIGIGALLGIGAMALVFRFVARPKTGPGENKPTDALGPRW